MGIGGFQPLARGVVTPRDDHHIILFVTADKHDCMEPYADPLLGSALEWDGPTDRFAERRMVDASQTDDEIHLFFAGVRQTPSFRRCSIWRA